MILPKSLNISFFFFITSIMNNMKKYYKTADQNNLDAQYLLELIYFIDEFIP